MGIATTDSTTHLITKKTANRMNIPQGEDGVTLHVFLVGGGGGTNWGTQAFGGRFVARTS